MSFLMATVDPNAKTAKEIADAAYATEQRERKQITAEWRVPTKGKLHVIEFEHGTTSGKRVLWIDGQEIIRRDFMFKLVGDDVFQLNDDVRCILRVNPAPGFKFEYALFVDGKSYEQYKDRQAAVLKTWQLNIGVKEYRVVMEKDTLNVFLNGVLREEEGEFVDGGTDTLFKEDDHEFRLTGRQTDAQRKGLVYQLFVDGVECEEVIEE